MAQPDGALVSRVVFRIHNLAAWRTLSEDSRAASGLETRVGITHTLEMHRLNAGGICLAPSLEVVGRT